MPVCSQICPAWLDPDGALHTDNQVPGAMGTTGPRQQQVIRVVSTTEQNEISEELWTVGS